MTTCIQYSRPSSGIGDSEVFGLDVAVNNLLSAYFKYGTQEQFICRPSDIPSFEHFKALASAAGHNAETKCIGIDPRQPRLNLEKIGCIFRPDPLTADIAWQRTQVSGRRFATCGLVHTMSSDRIAKAVGELAMAPTGHSDALICPSEAVRDAVRKLWDIQAEYINHRTGGHFQPDIQTPVIPLGINTEKFTKLTTPEKRAAQRQALNAADDEVIILFLGRLSFATKAHPLPLWLAVERAARLTKKKVRLVMLGYFKPKDMENHFRKLAADIFKTASIDFIMNDDARFPEGLWAGADIFTSLSDNVQESFGLTPIEAMAAGLPAVITDWDGYRGSIRNGEDGILIPTLMPPASAGLEIAQNYFNDNNYGVYLSGASQSTAVNIEHCAAALHVLINEPEQRKRMGANGRERAASVFDWKHIIKAYENLWAELAEKRQAPPTSLIPSNWQAASLSHPNPFAMFSGFATGTLRAEHRVQIAVAPEFINIIMSHDMNYFVPELLLPQASMYELIEIIRKAGTPSIADILAPFPATAHDKVYRCIGWMLKHGIATVVMQ